MFFLFFSRFGGNILKYWLKYKEKEFYWLVIGGQTYDGK